MSVYDMMNSGATPDAGMPEAFPSQEGLDPTEKEAIEMLEMIAQKEPDNAKSAAITEIVAKLYKLLADEEDTQMKMMGGDPKQLRAMSRAGGAG